MANEWVRRKVGEVATCNTDTYSPKEEWEYVHYLDTGSITAGMITSIQRITDHELLPSRARRKVQPGDIVYSTVRPNQRHYGIIKEPLPHMLVSTGFAVLRGIDGLCHNRFLYYYLTQSPVVDHLHSIAENSTSAYPSIRPTDILSLEIDLPSLPVQRRIAHILGMLDDKIELNRRMNRTLEKMAQAIFKSWFIDFDPVRAKAEGRDPNLAKEIADLFPDSFEDSEIGEIPKGWTAGPLTKIATLTTKTVRPSEWPDRFWEHYSIPAFDEARYPRWERGDTIKSGKYQVPPSCVLASKLNLQFPLVWLPDVADPTVAICSTEFMPFVPVNE